MPCLKSQKNNDAHSFDVWTTVQIILTKYKLIKMSTINLNSMKKWAGPIKHLGIDEKSPRLIGPILLHFDILIVCMYSNE